jgi:unsaturated rhamnogalacturonyl hydrolase
MLLKPLLVILLTCSITLAHAQSKPWSVRMADSFIARNRDSIVVGNQKTARWDYEQGLMLKAIGRVWQRTADNRYFEYIEKDVNRFVDAEGHIRTYKADEFNSDNITTGRVLLTLAQQTLPARDRYRNAAMLLRKQLADQPRNREGGFWHKKRYPNQMWLDGLYMIEPFYAEFAAVYDEPADFDDVARQFVLIEAHLKDPKTGLLYHGYDESRAQQWANPKTGTSPNFWGRAMGWYLMALVDVLDYFPQNHPQRPKLVGYLQRLAPILARYQDPKTGCWFQIVDQGNRAGNYPEASASCMYVYALAKGVRLGYLPNTLGAVAKKGYAGILKTFVETEADGSVSLNGTVSVGGLGGSPYRDGSYAYYLSEPIRKNDLKGVGPFIMASVEMEIAQSALPGAATKTVGVDHFFNHEFRKRANAIPGITPAAELDKEPFHYLWEDRQHSGFWWWGNTFRELGARTVTVPTAPTAASLKGLDVYIIVDPDTPKETAAPNYIGEDHIRAITDWVRTGGTLVLLANDSANCELPHFNRLAAQFGMQFLPNSRNLVQGTHWEQGRINIPPGNPIFPQTRTIYVKELAPIGLSGPAKAVLTNEDYVVMATATVGKGRVFALGDPWLYNEYVDARRIPAQYENFQAAQELARWLLR